MKIAAGLIVVVAAAFAAPAAWCEEIAGLPLHVEELAPGAIRVWLGDHVSSTNVVSIATEKGIVVVDTFGVPEVDAELRKVIARELGRSDFRFLINTHEHGDHTGGNAAYDDCTIVGHELIADGLIASSGRNNQILDWYRDHLLDLESELQALEIGSPKAAAKSEELIYNRLFYAKLQAEVDALAPDLTFRDRMTLDLGDTTFELSYVGGMHTRSDIIVFVPEHGLLLTGDLMADVWLTESPGCLANFVVRDGIPHDFPRFLANWDDLLGRGDQIATILPGHWNGKISMDGAKARVEYVRILWNGVHEADKSGLSVMDVQAQYRLEARFPDLVGSPGFSAQNNHSSINELWRTVTNQVSAARAVFTLLSDDADENEIRRIIDEHGSESSDYFFFETEFNAYGYHCLQQGDIDNAVKIFEINTELYPESWNVYDSLGEALASRGDTERATANYLKSLELNPESETGQAYIDRVSTS